MKFLKSERDWWAMHRVDEKNVELETYTFEIFFAAVSQQVAKQLKAMRLPLELQHTVDHVVTPKRFQLISDHMRQLRLNCEENPHHFYPVLTFHATQNPQCASSIVQNGFLLPGDLADDSGFVLKMAHGKYFGEGVYSSQNVHLASMYAKQDLRGQVFLFVNLAILGCVDWDVNSQYKFAFDSLYDGEFNTRYIRNSGILVSGDPRDLIPLALVTISPPPQPLSIAKSPYYSLSKSVVTMHKVMPNFYLSVLPKELESKRKCEHLIIGDALILKTEPMSQFIDALNGRKSVYVIGKGRFESVQNVVTFAQLKDVCLRLNSSSSGEFDLFPALTAAFESISDSNVNYCCCILLKSFPHLDLDNFISRFETELKVRCISIKLILCDESLTQEPSLQNVLRLKRLSTISVFEDSYYCAFGSDSSKSALSAQLLRVLAHTKLVENLSTYIWSCRRYSSLIGQGFIDDISKLPKWEITSSCAHVLYRGKDSDVIFVNNDPMAVKYTDTLSVDQLPLLADCIMLLLSDYSLRYAYDISKFKATAESVGEFLNLLFDKLVEFASTDSSRETKRLLRRVALQVESLGSLQKKLCKFNYGFEWYVKLRELKHGKKIMQRSKHVFTMENIKNELISLGITNSKFEEFVAEPADALRFSDIVGLGVSVKRSDASAIEPWLLKVRSINSERFKVSELGSVVDSRGKKISCILPDSEESDSDLLKMLYGSTFTGNPYLYLDSQPIALLAISWVHAIKSLFVNFRSARLREREATEDNQLRRKQLAQVIFKLTPRVIKAFSSFPLPLDEGKVISLISDQSQTPSICMFLCRLLISKEHCQSTAICRAVLSEAVQRSIKAMLKGCGNSNALSHIRTLLGVNESDHLDINASASRSLQIYSRNATNCSPFAVVAAIGLIQQLNTVKNVDGILYSLKEEISMKKFLNAHYCGQIGSAVQVDLLVSGLLGKICTNAEAHLKSVFDDQKRLLIVSAVNLDKKRQKANVRLQLRIDNAHLYLDQHSQLKQFTHSEVAKLNLDNNNITISDSFLPVHHCAYRNCSNFLVSFETESDKRNHTRNGLMHHLQYESLNHNYVPSLHLAATAIAKMGKSFESFEQKTMSYFSKKSINLRERLRNCDNILQDIWQFSQTLK